MVAPPAFALSSVGVDVPAPLYAAVQAGWQNRAFGNATLILLLLEKQTRIIRVGDDKISVRITCVAEPAIGAAKNLAMTVADHGIAVREFRGLRADDLVLTVPDVLFLQHSWFSLCGDPLSIQLVNHFR